MLVLSRGIGEEIVIGDHVRIIVAAIKGRRVSLGISAPPGMVVNREEVHRQQVNGRTATGPSAGNVGALPTR